MNSYQYYRELLGLSQEELAIYLQLNRHTLAKAEKSQRSLPTSAHIRLMELIIHHPENVQEESFTDLEAIFGDELSTYIQTTLQEKEWQLHYIKEKYIQLCEQLRLQTQRKHTFERALQNLNADDPHQIHIQNFMEYHLNEVSIDLDKSYQIEILNLVSKIKGLEAELVYLSSRKFQNIREIDCNEN